jgi:hypothetical protein
MKPVCPCCSTLLTYEGWTGERIRTDWSCSGCDRRIQIYPLYAEAEPRDPIASAVRAELEPLADALIDAGHKLARCVTCRKREGVEALAGQCEECARGDAMLEQRSW